MKKKKLIIILVIVVVLGMAFGAFKIYTDQQKMTDEIVNVLMQGEGASQFQLESLLAGEYNTGEKYLKIKDTEKFQARLYEEVQAFLSANSSASSYDYVHEKLSTVMNEGLLTDEALQLISDYEVAAAKEYKAMVDDAVESKDYEGAAKALFWIADKDVVEISGLDIYAVLDDLMENCQIYSLQNNTGAYYDAVELRSSSSYKNEGVDWMDPIGYTSRSYVEKAYGDFCVGTSHSKTHYEALEGYDFEHKYNTESTSSTLYLRGRDVNGYFWADSLILASNNGAKYIFCRDNSTEDTKADEAEADGIVMLDDDRLYIMGYYGSVAGADNCVYIEGDFSEYIKEAKNIYNANFSVEGEVARAQKLVEEKNYEEAMNILQFYTHLEGGLDNIYTIAVDCIREGQTELGLEILENIPFFEPIQGLDMDYMIGYLDGSFNPDINNVEYTKVFLRLMMDVVGPMNDADITAAFSGKSFKNLPQGTYQFGADGTGTSKSKSFGSTISFTWTVQDGKVLIQNEGNGDPKAYDVHNVLPGYYLLSYTTEHSTHVFMTLLKEQ